MLLGAVVPGSSDTEYVEYDIIIGGGTSHCHINGNADTTQRGDVLRLPGWGAEMKERLVL